MSIDTDEDGLVHVTVSVFFDEASPGSCRDSPNHDPASGQLVFHMNKETGEIDVDAEIDYGED